MTCTAAPGVAVAGLYRNVGTATGKSPDGRETSDSDPSHYLGTLEEPAIDVQKATNGQDADAAPGPSILVGRPVTWTYVVSNPGDTPLSGVTVVDDHGVVIYCGGVPILPEEDPEFDDGQPFSLAVGESVTCVAHGSALAGQYENVATASGGTMSESAVEDSDPSHYFGEAPEDAGIDLEKSTNGQDADAPPGPVIPVGDPVAWTYQVTNTGSVSLTNVAVSDDHGVVVSCPKAALAPAESMTCTAAGVAVVGLYSNVGMVTAKSPAGATVYDTTPAITSVRSTGRRSTSRRRPTAKTPTHRRGLPSRRAMR